ncbi:MAG: putative sulfate/molybdate transporter [Chitinispirillaceae bacterium]|jgi:hypothetical protein|nr:putative sulfate/molybdate transporter [Chitinispirillaceae bacterium]
MPHTAVTFFRGLRFNRMEFAGAFGDIGTDIPLLIGVMLATGMDTASGFILFGVMQIFSGFVYRLPIPAQPLKAMAAIIIAQKLSAGVVSGGALAIGVIVLVLTLTGALSFIGRIVPLAVIRGMQLGLGIQLAMLALKQYLPSAGTAGFILAGAAFVVAVALFSSRKVPAALVVALLGAAYTIGVTMHWQTGMIAPVVSLPRLHLPGLAEIAAGFVLLALPQLPLSIGNSLLATRQLSTDLFPETPVAINSLGKTYAAMNIVNAFFGGIPTCHGSGGMAGHYAFGARTGGSVIMYGSLFVFSGLFFSSFFSSFIQAFPLPILGIVLLFEASMLVLCVRDVASVKSEFMITILVGLAACSLPYGFGIALVLGTVLSWLQKRHLITLVREATS